MKTPCTARSMRRRLCVALGLLGAVSAAGALANVDQKLAQRYGGVLAPECGDYLSPQLLYPGDSLVVRDGGKPVLTGRNVKAAPGYFGTSPPPGFETALTSEVAGGEKLVFVFYRNPSGLFVTVEGGPKVMAAVPKVLKGTRVRHCDPNRNAVPGAKPPEEIYPGVLLKDAKFRRAYVQAIGPLASEPWLMRMDGPAQAVTKVQAGGRDYRLVSVCKNHDCYDNNLVLLYDAATQTAYGKVLLRARPILVGAPPAPIAAELERLWKTTYRSGK